MINRLGILVLVFISLFAIAIILWINTEATIHESDIEITGKLIPYELRNDDGIRFDHSYNYVLEMEIDSKTEQALYISGKKYFYTVYYYINGVNTGSWEHYNPVTFEEYRNNIKSVSVGSHGFTERLAMNKLEDVGIKLNKDQTNFMGISYSGDEYPIGVRFHLNSNKGRLDESRMWLIYAHYEKKLGKDVSWAKLVPVKLVDE